MKLQGRSLSIRMQGEDVKLLHRELAQLGFTIPETETRDGMFGPRTEEIVKRFQTSQRLQPTGIVDEPTAVLINREVDKQRPAPLPPLVVRGHVRHSDGRPFSEGTVQAFDKDLRREELLGEAKPDARGFYEIRYSQDQFRRAEKKAADLVVRVLDRRQEVLAASGVRFNALPVETVDLRLEASERLSEFERYASEIKPVLEELPPAELKEDDIDFVARETGIPPLHVAYYAVAHQHAQVTKIEAEVFYGLFREDVPTNLPALLLQPSASLRRALASCIRAGIIPARFLETIELTLAALGKQIGERILANPEGGDALPGLLAQAGLSKPEQEAFLTAYLNHAGDSEAFWRSLQVTSLTPRVQPLQRTLQLGLVTQNNLPLLQALSSKNVRSVGDIPRLGQSELQNMILGSNDILAAIPTEDTEESSDEKAARTVEGIFEVLNAAIPTAFLQAAYEKSEQPLRRGMAQVLANAPELELRDAHLDSFLADHPDALKGVADAEAVVHELKRAQRAIRVAPNAAHAEALLAEGLDSAWSIISLAPADFEAKFADQFGGPMQARAYYQKAQQVNGSVLAVMSAVQQSVAGISPMVIPFAPDSVKALPNFSALFGRESFCSCEHCGSVLSPAAYLVDLLEFINPKRGWARPITKLRQKRPDLEHIPLTCANTNTPLPYVDLVNEVMEFYVANETLTAAAARDTKGVSADELSINPQYVIDSAYQKLAGTVYPQSLPFHRPLESARFYLEHLGASRHQVMQAFRGGDQPGDADIDLEYLKISLFERDILTGNSGKPLAEFYGYPAAQDPSVFTEVKASEFLKRMALSYEVLIQLLATRVLNADGTIKLEDDENPPRCDLTKTFIKNLTPAFWQKAHRIVRLWRKLGWSLAELDRAMTVFQETDVSLGLLTKLAATLKLKAQWKVSLNVLLSLWGDIDSEGPDSLYAKLFLNITLRNPPDPAFVLGAPENASALLEEHRPAVMAALRLSAADLEALSRHLGLSPDPTPLNLANLSALHRHGVLARVLKLKVREYVLLVRLIGEAPLAPADPGATLRFVEHVQLVKNSGFDVDQLEYLYLNNSEMATPIALSASSVMALLRSLQAGLQKSAQALDPNVNPLQPLLTAVIGEGPVEQALAIIDGTSSLTEVERAAFIDAHFTGFLDPAEAKSLLLDPAATQATKREYILRQLNAHTQKGFVAQTLAEAVGIDSGIVALLLQKVLKSPDEPAKPMLSDFLRLAEVTEVIPDAPVEGSALTTTLEAIHQSFVRLHKAALLLKGFGISKKELAYLAMHSADFDGFDLNALPLSEAEFQVVHFQQWRRLARLFAFRNSLPQNEVDLIDVFAAAYLPQDQNPRQTAIDQLKKASGWPLAEVDFLVGPNGFNLANAEDFRNETKLVPLQPCVRLSKQFGTTCERLFAWAGAEPDAAMANDIASTVKAKYTDEEWLAVAKPINDTLREKQKAALISYILAHDAKVKQLGINHADGLFAYFLIDVEMGACMKTSRIKQAISSVQLFIQRCLMNLEEGVSPTAIDADQWEWMKNYRVWEANRKVFLYPENWIEPELRDDKSPFFKELETELLQNDLTLETAEQAFVHYLEKLDKVARLEICGLYVQEPQEANDEEVVHVFGRTKDSPHVYYYRRLLNRRTWTPWEKVDMDIEGDHLIPVVYNRRLYLFWLHFEEKPDDNQQLTHAYIQSAEHYRWATQDYEKWKTDHTNWRKKRDAYNTWNRLYTQAQAVFALLEDQGAAIIDGLKNMHVTHIQGIYPELGFVVEDLNEPGPAEPREPEEPPFSAPPPLTYWEIKLAWSEYKGGRWSAKETSSESVMSPHVATSFHDWFKDWSLEAMKSYNEQFKVMREREDGSLEETIFSVYLPTKEEHFVRVDRIRMGLGDEDSGPPSLFVYRRYSHVEPIFADVTSLEIKGYEFLGLFSLNCGSEVKALSLPSLTSLDYESLKRPDGTTNRSMSLRHETGVPKLLFSAEGSPQEILRKLPDSGEYDLLYQHQYPEFQLKPPFQDFFYQDQPKTYFASYYDDSPTGVIQISHQAVLAGNMQQNAALITSVKNSLPSFGNKQQPLASLPMQAVQSGAPSSLALAKSGQQNAPAQPLKTAGVTGLKLKTIGAKKIFDLAKAGGLAGLIGPQEGLRFETFFHPHVCEFIERMYRDGIPGLLSRTTQQLDHDAKKNIFTQLYDPSALVAEPYPREHVDFGRGAYALYNWELFFHIPMLIAVSLTKNQRFEDAMYWYHFIFNPTTNDTTKSPRRYWNTLPFHNNSHPEKEQIQEMMLTLAGKKPGWKQIEAQIEEWLDDPFNPHLIARLRITAYQKNVVMKYIDNLIAWGDQLFRRDTIEAINEATLLYVLAYDILGPRPETIPRHSGTEAKTYKQIESDLDAFGNLLVAAENLMPYKSGAPSLSWSSRGRKRANAKLPKLKGPLGAVSVAKSAVQSLYFCVPRNEELLRYWDTVEDRLFKIRHCMNIEGVARELPLFEPPIDPALLVRARAAGVDLGSVLNDLYAPVPHYRFNVMLQKALELCNELKSLGGALLSALEKRDAESLANLRAAQETALLKAVREVKQQQIDEAKANIDSLSKTRAVTEARYGYYRDIERISKYEQDHMDGLSNAHSFNLASQSTQALASVAYQFPNATMGSSGAWSSPVATVTFGGSTAGAALQSAGTVLSMIAAAYTHDAAMASIMGGHERRWDEWKFQESLAKKELDQIDKQIAAADIRLAITEKELENHERQIENATAIEEFLRGKYTNEDLYNWMITQVSKIYFQAYKLAYDLAKRAERTYRHELGLQDSNFIQFGYWDNLKKGLLAGEQLALDLKRMDAGFLAANKREYELTKHVSLRQLSPLAMLSLKATGSCEVTVPEWLFDLDCPGHYMRRIKTVSLSIPSVSGPYTSVNCTLSLLKSSLRTSPLGDDYARDGSEDSRFVDYYGTIQSIVTSSGNQDSGLFEMNLRDERFLPFEGAGAESTWKLELPADFRQFDYNAIADVILHMRYTARPGGAQLRDRAVAHLEQRVSEASTSGLILLFSLKQDFPSEWHQFVTGNENFAGAVKREYFPYFTQGKDIIIDAMQLHAIEAEAVNQTTPQGLDLAGFTSMLNDSGSFQLSLAPDGVVIERDQQAHVFVLIKYSVVSA